MSSRNYLMTNQNGKKSYNSLILVPKSNQACSKTLKCLPSDPIPSQTSLLYPKLCFSHGWNFLILYSCLRWSEIFSTLSSTFCLLQRFLEISWIIHIWTYFLHQSLNCISPPKNSGTESFVQFVLEHILLLIKGYIKVLYSHYRDIIEFTQIKFRSTR